jgi:AcrR family transcriptional regulator
MRDPVGVEIWIGEVDDICQHLCTDTICSRACQDKAMTRVYAGATAVERRERRHAQLLEAALDVFGESGLPGVGVRSVSARAGLAPRYFYESFADRDALLLALYDRLAEESATAALTAIAAAPDEPRARVRAGLVGGLETLERDPRRGRLLFVDAAAEPGLQQRRDATILRFAEILRVESDAIWHGAAARERMVPLSIMLMGGWAELLAWWLADPARADRELILDLAVGLYVAAIGTEY